ncbi:hypothetical protein BSKO_12645 [Bryopsis sp. KO-2023]|nr:hypothetical protein BSKO_12645 [Bryopsis sp. KO-2023]
MLVSLRHPPSVSSCPVRAGEHQRRRLGKHRRQRGGKHPALPVQISTSIEGRTCVQSHVELGCTPLEAFQLVATAERWPEWVASSSFVDSEGLLRVDDTITEWFGLLGLRLFSTEWRTTESDEGKSLEILSQDVLGIVQNVVLRFGMEKAGERCCRFDFVFSWECRNAAALVLDRLFLRFFAAVDTYIALLSLKQLVESEIGRRPDS